MSFGYSECGEAVQDGNTNLERRNLTVEVTRPEPQTQQFQTVHLAFDAASAVVTEPTDMASPFSSAWVVNCEAGILFPHDNAGLACERALGGDQADVMAASGKLCDRLG